MSNTSGIDKILVDTDILIDYSKLGSKILEKLLDMQEGGKVVLYTNAVILAEFFTDKKLKTKSKHEKTEDFFKQFTPLDINKTMGIVAGKIVREGQIPFVGDALIAATCLVSGFKLATRNKKHFRKVPKLKFYEI